MKRIGIISDTHGLLRPEVKDRLQGCDRILHGGDINKQTILDELGKIAPVSVVRGNNDKEWADKIPESFSEDVYGLKIYMIHNKKHMPKDIPKVDMVIFGHSHKYEDKYIDGIRFLNPGSCGPRRFHQEISMAVLYIREDGSYSVEKIVIEHPDVKENDDKIPEDIGEKLPAIMHDISQGKTVRQLARKYKISEKISEQIMRMYLTHPGIDSDGIMRRIGI